MDMYNIGPDRIPVKVESIYEWIGMSNTHQERTVGRNELADGVVVSTVFLGLDHSFIPGEPVLFETMVFGGVNDEWQKRYTSWESADFWHNKIVALLTADPGYDLNENL